MKDKLEEIKKEFEKTFQTEVGTKGSRRVWGTATDVWNFFEPLIQESNRESVRDAYRKGYFDSGVQPTSSEVIKFEKSYMEYLKSLDKKGKL